MSRQRHSKPPSSYLDLYINGPYSEALVEHRSAGISPVTIVHCKHLEGDYSDPAQPDILLYMPLRHPVSVTRDMGTQEVSLDVPPGHMDIAPPNTDVKILFDNPGEALVFALPYDHIKQAIEDYHPNFKGDFGALHDVPFVNSQAKQLACQIWYEANSNNLNGNLYADSLLLMLVATLLRAAEIPVQPHLSKAPVIDARTMKTLTEKIEQMTDQVLCMDDLATLADMSQASFFRAFKSTTGQSPYQYVLDQRMFKAQERLRSDNSSLLDIALECGFSSQQHFTSLFSSRVGISPGRYRRQFRG